MLKNLRILHVCYSLLDQMSPDDRYSVSSSLFRINKTQLQIQLGDESAIFGQEPLVGTDHCQGHYCVLTSVCIVNLFRTAHTIHLKRASILSIHSPFIIIYFNVSTILTHVPMKQLLLLISFITLLIFLVFTVPVGVCVFICPK
jgi:hypothetical protein